MRDKLEYRPKVIEEGNSIRSKIEGELASFHLPEIPEGIVDHFTVLEKHSHFNDDSRMALGGVKNFLKFLDDSDSSFRFIPIDKKRLYLATYLSDIGKSSALEDSECQVAVARLFAIENIPPEKIHYTVQQILEDKNYFPGGESEINDMVFGLARAGIITHKTTMREFWDKHATWTSEILDQHPMVFDKETRIIAASHHIDRNINPQKINIKEVSKELRFSIFLLMAMDKYQAFLIRNEETRDDHEKSMKALRTALGQYDGDELMQFIIKTIDQLGATGSLFSKNDNIKN